jgi:hypothetical protein
MRVAVIDIGTPGKNLGWAIDGPDDGGTDLDLCVETLIDSLRSGPVALGFEAPQFVPLRRDPKTLTAAREGESGPGLPTRSFSTGAGAAVLATALVIAPYVLRRLRKALPHASATFDWQLPLTKPGELLLFEAFVTDQGKETPERHVEDARLAVKSFRRDLALSFEGATSSEECMNLLGAALLRIGWSSDVALLSASCLVIRSGNNRAVDG